MKNKIGDKIYFPGLNGLRFFAALAVIITHVELMKNKFGYENLWSNPFIHELGILGVSFFFVLSGYLITYLLLIEKDTIGVISLKSFYMRRILRIWPLYYFILILGFVLFPAFEFFEISYFTEHFQSHFWGNLILYLLILPNLAFSFFSAVPLIGQSWSIGVEEQFYILWPLLIKFRNYFSFKFLISILMTLILMKFIILILSINYENEQLIVLKKFAAMAKFENMIIGGIGAMLLKNKLESILNIIYYKATLIFSILGLFVLIYITPKFLHDGVHLFQSVFFLVIILNVSSNPNSIIKIENRLFNFLGKISYGIYMYHLIVIFIVIKLMSFMEITNPSSLKYNVVLYLFSIGITLFVSHLSYKYFESIFLKKKVKYSSIESGAKISEV